MYSLVLLCRSCIAGDDFNIILGLSNHCLKLVSWHGEVNSIYHSQRTVCSGKIIGLFTQKEREKRCMCAFTLSCHILITQFWNVHNAQTLMQNNFKIMSDLGFLKDVGIKLNLINYI